MPTLRVRTTCARDDSAHASALASLPSILRSLTTSSERRFQDALHLNGLIPMPQRATPVRAPLSIGSLAQNHDRCLDEGMHSLSGTAGNTFANASEVTPSPSCPTLRRALTQMHDFRSRLSAVSLIGGAGCAPRSWAAPCRPGVGGRRQISDVNR